VSKRGVPNSKTFEILASAIGGSAFTDEDRYADRFAARTKAIRLIEHDHMAAAMILSFAPHPTRSKSND
jgi:hypothetical protein